MQGFQVLLFGMGAGLTNAGFLVAIAVLACVLGAEIAGICILVSKMLRARAARRERRRNEGNDVNQSAYHYDRAIGALVLLGAIPQASYNALTVLAVLTAVAAVAFVALLIVFRACGYDFESNQARAAKKVRTVSDAPEALPDEEPAYAVLPDDEEQAQEAYTPPVLPDESEAYEDDAPLTVFEADAEDTEAPLEEGGSIAPAVQSSTVTPAEGEPLFSDGSRPYKVVEKVVTETVKEVYRENPATPAQSQSGTDAVMEKLADFLEYELQKRRENDQAAAGATAAGNAESLPTFAAADLPDDDLTDEEDDEDDDLTDAETAAGDEDDDVDDEENDTEGDHFTGSERIIGFDEDTGCYIVAHYRKSFEAKLIQSRPNIKQYYSEIKNALLSWGGTKSRISWAADSFTNERTPIAKINVKVRTLELYLALDPASLEDDGIYKGQDVSGKKKYADTPFRYKIRSPRKLKWALELVQRTCEEHGLSPIDAEPINYEEQYPFDTTESLVERKLIKEYIRQEKPATTFELAPDHVPDVPAEDESVIPANANFSWEFDNEVMEAEAEAAEAAEAAAEAEEVVAEAEEAPAEEASVEEAPAAEPSVYKETVKVTEMRYTERYYAGGAPTYERVITTEEPTPALAEPVVAEFEEQPIVPTAQPADEPADPFAVYSDMTDDAPVAEPEEIADAMVDASVENGENGEDFEETEEPAEDAVETFAEEDDALTDGLSCQEETEDGVWNAADEPPTAYIVESEPIEEPEPTPVKETPPANPAVAVVDLHAVEEHFPMGAVIDLDALKEKELVLPTATTLKVYASAPISKSFTVEANHFTLDAIQAITDADGDSVMVR